MKRSDEYRRRRRPICTGDIMHFFWGGEPHYLDLTDPKDKQLAGALHKAGFFYFDKAGFTHLRVAKQYIPWLLMRLTPRLDEGGGI